MKIRGSKWPKWPAVRLPAASYNCSAPYLAARTYVADPHFGGQISNRSIPSYSRKDSEAASNIPASDARTLHQPATYLIADHDSAPVEHGLTGVNGISVVTVVVGFETLKRDDQRSPPPLCAVTSQSVWLKWQERPKETGGSLVTKSFVKAQRH